mmetsp:Transcript_20904/g.29209  ORF Transcript_20904/g.29209 Transcript_20904/m.29209 type:complete len:116 (-) Transcript_20904:1906-2253(-)
MKFSSATVLLWILSFTCLLHLASAGGQVIPIDISEHMNFDMLGLNPDYPRGEVKFADIPFTLVEEGFTGWSSGNGGFGGNIYPGTWTMVSLSPSSCFLSRLEENMKAKEKIKRER